jgi:glycerol-3-phosphate acyltransferase PlsY
VIVLLAKVLLSYLLGSVVGSLVVGRLRGGVDIRTLGSGNAGGTNALRTQGKAFALWVMLIDVGKGWLAAGPIAALALPGFAGGSGPGWTAAACGLAAIVGHVYPLWYGFRGGKGAATLVGALLALAPVLVAALIGVWLVVVVLAGFVGLATMVATASLPVLVAAWNVEPRAPLLAFGIVVAAFVAYTHRSNVARMRVGTEPRARRLWLLGRGAR